MGSEESGRKRDCYSWRIGRVECGGSKLVLTMKTCEISPALTYFIVRSKVTKIKVDKVVEKRLSSGA